MKKLSKKIVRVSAAVLFGAAGIAGGTVAGIVKSLPEGFTVTAHTGCEATKDNSLEAIIAGKNAGADIVEFDLRFDSEGMGILSHDKNEKDPVSLEQALKTISEYEGLRVNVDCKTTDNLKEVYRLGEKYGITERLFYTGIEEKDVAAAKEQTPQIPYFLNYKVDEKKKNDEQYIKSLIALVKEKGALGLNINHGQCSRKLVKMFREENLMVSVWTANSVKIMLKCISFAPDNITTRYPQTLTEIIEKFK